MDATLLGQTVFTPPELCEARFIMDGCTLFDYFWTVEQKHPPIAILTLGRARKNFNTTPYWRCVPNRHVCVLLHPYKSIHNPFDFL